MVKQLWAWMSIIIGIQLGVWSVAEAGTVTWSVKSNTGAVVCQGSGTNSVNLPATCGNDLDFIDSGGTAKIEAIDSGTNDILQLLFTKIVAKKNIANYVLTFDHTFAPGPKKTDYTPIYYRTHMYGTNISGTAPANRISVTSTIEHPVGTPVLNASVQPAPPPATNFSYYQSPSTSADWDQNRKIIVRVTFSLENTKYVNFGVGRFVKVSAQTFPDPPEDEGSLKPGSTRSFSEIQSEVQQMIESGDTACIGVALPDGSCAGIHVSK